MGKYMRKCRGAAGEEVAGVEVTQVVGVRTRSRSAAAPAAAGGVAKVVAPRRKKALTPPNVATEEPASGGDGGSCYIKLRSRTLFMAPPPQQPSAPRAPVPVEAVGAGQGTALVAGLSRCSSTASSVDVGCQDRSLACRSDAAEAGGDHILEVSATNSGSGPDRERRETTPSSRAHGEVSDLESDLAGQKNGRSSPATTSSAQLITPPADEIRKFFAVAEKAQAERFAAKYNFDVVRGVPLDGGRFEWTPVFSI